MRFSMTCTGSEIARPRSSGRILLCSGSRCWTTTKASPGLAASAEKNILSASMPPAEAPMPTIGKSARSCGASSPGELPSLLLFTRYPHGGTILGRFRADGTIMVHQEAPHQFGVSPVLLGAGVETIGEVVMCEHAFALRAPLRQRAALL